jgi:hypothetical protein
MNVSQVSSSSLSQAATAQTGDAVGVSVLKKALQVQQEGATQLINSLPQPTKAPEPGQKLGSNIDVRV